MGALLVNGDRAESQSAMECGSAPCPVVLPSQVLLHFHFPFMFKAVVVVVFVGVLVGQALCEDDFVRSASALCRAGSCQEARQLLETAHESSASVKAAGTLAELYLTGRLDGESRHLGADYQAARVWLEKGAALGDPDCHRSLGFMHATGIGINGTVDMAKSLLHYFLGARSGFCMECSMAVGYRYLYGYGVSKSCDSAVKFYTDAASEAIATIDKTAAFERIRLTDESNRNRPAEESKDVIHYFENAAAGGDINAQLALGQLSQRGLRGMPQDVARAAEYFERAAQQGDANAMAHLATVYVNGEGRPQNNQTALKLFKKSAALGNAAGYTGLGFLYMTGRGVERNMQLALKYYKEGADLGAPEAQYELALLYLDGEHVERSYSTALHYFTQAAHQGHTPSLFNLAQLHLMGMGTIKSCSLAVRLHKVVAERGPWASHRHNQGHENFLNGNYEAALWAYSQCAMVGDEICQLNTAWMLSEAIGYYHSDHTKLAVIFWRMAADQGSAYAQRILGDLSYSGIVSGGAEEAMRRYQQAADRSDAQALFNLGYMYEWGPVQDLYLAKRAYDQCKQASPLAAVPVKLALSVLSIHMWWRGLPNSSDLASKDPSRSQIDSESVENVILAVLCAALAVVVFIRQRRIVRL